MGLVSLPILNRLGFSNNWNLNIFSKFINFNYYSFFYLINIFFNIFFLDFFFKFFKSFSWKHKTIVFFLYHLNIGHFFFISYSKWIILYLNYSFFKNTNTFFLYQKNLKLKKIFFNFKKKFKLNYKSLI